MPKWRREIWYLTKVLLKYSAGTKCYSNAVQEQSVTQIQCRNKLLHKHSAGTTVGAHLHQNVGIVALDEVDHGSNLRELSDLRSHSA
jgi:hypothetical protein